MSNDNDVQKTHLVDYDAFWHGFAWVNAWLWAVSSFVSDIFMHDYVRATYEILVAIFAAIIAKTFPKKGR